MRGNGSVVDGRVAVSGVVVRTGAWTMDDAVP